MYGAIKPTAWPVFFLVSTILDSGSSYRRRVVGFEIRSAQPVCSSYPSLLDRIRPSQSVINAAVTVVCSRWTLWPTASSVTNVDRG